MKCDRALEAARPGNVDAMKNWRGIALHIVAAAAFMFLLQRHAMSSSPDSSLLWPLTIGGCAAALAYIQTNR